MAPTHPTETTPSHNHNHPLTTPPSTLLTIIDIHPLSWSLLSSPPSSSSRPRSQSISAHGTGNGNAPGSDYTIDKVHFTPLDLTEFVTIFMVFLNAHLASRWGNQVVVYATTAGKAKLLYPPPPNASAGPSAPKANSYRPFQLLDSRIEQGLREMIAEEEERLQEEYLSSLNESPAMVSALTKALCYINRTNPPNTNTLTDPTAPVDPTSSSSTHGPDRPETRILVVNATPGSTSIATSEEVDGHDGQGKVQSTSGSRNGSGNQMRGGYVGLMNCVFAAQKAKVPIDVLSLPPPYLDSAPPIFLQQAAHLTEGIYWQWNGKGGLLQYLHGIYLPPPSLRQHPFAVPPQDAVGFRAACFCHHKTLDVGFVCSVCLSIFCEPRPVCLMCKTKFPLKSIPTLRALAANIQPIPIPNTIIPPRQPTSRGRAGAMNPHPQVDGEKKRKEPVPIEID